MRDYVIHDRRTGRTIPISEAPLPWISAMIRKLPSRNGKSQYNPGVTKGAYLDRLRLELLIRQLGLRD